MDIFPYKSRYRNTNMIVVDGVETVSVWNQPSYLIERPDDSLIQKYYVSNAMQGRPDLISQAVYGTPDLDWVVIAFNNPRELLNWPHAGEMIDIVARELVFAEL